MKTLYCTLLLVIACSLLAVPVAAQDLVINNVRIIVGNGQVVQQGTILIRGGRIVSAAAGAAAAPGVRAIDGRGLTAVPGYIDAHRHIVGGRNAEAWLKDEAPTRMREFLEAGYTTLMSGGGAAEPVVALKKAIDSGQMKGPRIIPSAPLQVGGNATPASAREAIRKMAAADIHFTGEIRIDNVNPDPKEAEVIAAAADEGKKVGVEVAVHAATVVAMNAAVKAGVPKLVHTPHGQWATDADAQAVKAAGIHVSSCTGFGAPVFNVFNKDNAPTFRDRGKWPDAIGGEGRGREAGLKPVNGRTLFDNGVVYGYCTDTGYLPLWGLAQELRVLNLMFSPIDLVKILGPNSATWINMSKDLGTLEAGKIADIVLLGGNPLGGTPLNGYWDFLNVQVTIKGGELLVDKRAAK